MQTSTIDTRNQRGFTLVELAIVLVIVGLLIGGILKGQELIGNTRVTTTVSQIKGVEAAAVTFQDTYNAMPGDMINAATRVPNCTAGNSCQNGNGDGQINNIPGAAIGAAGENSGFFIQLGLVDLLDGVGTPVAGWAAGQGIMGAKLSNAHHFRVGTSNAVANLTGVNAIGAPRQGTYMALSNAAVGAAVAAGDTALSPSQALRIDRKYDDGRPLTGVAIGGGAVQSAANAQDGCITAAAANADYATSNANPSCNAMYLRILG